MIMKRYLLQGYAWLQSLWEISSDPLVTRRRELNRGIFMLSLANAGLLFAWFMLAQQHDATPQGQPGDFEAAYKWLLFGVAVLTLAVWSGLLVSFICRFMHWHRYERSAVDSDARERK
jgi:hypothetical protein